MAMESFNRFVRTYGKDDICSPPEILNCRLTLALLATSRKPLIFNQSQARQTICFMRKTKTKEMVSFNFNTEPLDAKAPTADQ